MEAAGTQPVEKKSKLARRIFKGCALGCLLPLVLLFVVGWIALMIVNHPRLNASHAQRVDVNVYIEAEPFTNHIGSITNAAQVRGLLAVLAQSGTGMDHKCKPGGWFLISYDNGETKRIQFLPGHRDDRYEYRTGFCVRIMDRTEFLSALRSGGIDTNAMPRLDHER